MPVYPSVDLTNFDIAPVARQVQSAGDAAASAAAVLTRDAAYTVIGLGILTYQRIQVRRREIERSLRN